MADQLRWMEDDERNQPDPVSKRVGFILAVFVPVFLFFGGSALLGLRGIWDIGPAWRYVGGAMVVLGLFGPILFGVINVFLPRWLALLNRRYSSPRPARWRHPLPLLLDTPSN